MQPTWQSDCGTVQLYHADARDVLPALADCSVDMVFTDQPYGHNNNNGDLIHRREAALGRLPRGDDLPLARPITNDGSEASDLVRWAFSEFQRLLAPGCCCCCCCGGGGGPDPQFARWALWLDEAVGFKQMVVWDKGPMGMGWHYRRSYETVLVGQKPGAACRWFAETNSVENIIRSHTNGIRKIIPSEHDHPTPKPIGLSSHFIKLHSQEGDTVLDPFMGRGPTGVSCAKLARMFIGIELDHEHFQHAKRRIIEALNSQPLIAEAERKEQQRALALVT